MSDVVYSVKHSQKYAKYYSYFYHDYLKKMVECNLDIDTDNPILLVDLGCGNGIQLENLSKKNKHPNSVFVGVECNPFMCDMAKSRCEKDSRIVIDNIDVLEFLRKMQTFDFVNRPFFHVYFCCLGNTVALVSSSDLREWAVELKRLCKEISANSYRFILEYRDGTTYKDWIGDGRIEILNHAEDGRHFCFQVLRPVNKGYSVDIKLFSIGLPDVNGTVEAIVVEEQESCAYFFDVNEFLRNFMRVGKHDPEDDSRQSGLGAGGIITFEINTFEINR